MAWLDHFGLIAPFYDRVLPVKQAERLIELTNLPVSGALLDAGGGTGRIAQVLKSMVSGVVVVDISSGMLRQVKNKNDLLPVQSHTERLAFEKAKFDRVIMIDALHHVMHQQETAHELWRVLKQGGRIVIEEPDISQLGVKFVALAEKILLMRSHFISPERILSLFNHENANGWIEKDGFNAWVIVEKLGDEKLS